MAMLVRGEPTAEGISVKASALPTASSRRGKVGEPLACKVRRNGPKDTRTYHISYMAQSIGDNFRVRLSHPSMFNYVQRGTRQLSEAMKEIMSQLAYRISRSHTPLTSKKQLAPPAGASLHAAHAKVSFVLQYPKQPL